MFRHVRFPDSLPCWVVPIPIGAFRCHRDIVTPAALCSRSRKLGFRQYHSCNSPRPVPNILAGLSFRAVQAHLTSFLLIANAPEGYPAPAPPRCAVTFEGQTAPP